MLIEKNICFAYRVKNVIFYSISEFKNEMSKNISFLKQQTYHLNERINVIQETLTIDHCRSFPCANGGTCDSLYNSFSCICPPEWEGRQCSVDFDECKKFNGTNLGCQNGGTCQNIRGGYM